MTSRPMTMNIEVRFYASLWYGNVIFQENQRTFMKGRSVMWWWRTRNTSIFRSCCFWLEQLTLLISNFRLILKLRTPSPVTFIQFELHQSDVGVYTFLCPRQTNNFEEFCWIFTNAKFLSIQLKTVILRKSCDCFRFRHFPHAFSHNLVVDFKTKSKAKDNVTKIVLYRNHISEFSSVCVFE